MTRNVLQGPFLTRAQVARRLRIPTSLVTHRPDLLRVGGKWLEEVYFSFQFDANGVRRELGEIVQTLKQDFDDIEIGHWLVRPNEALGLSRPLDSLAAGHATAVMAAACEDAAAAKAEEARPTSAAPTRDPALRRKPRPRRRPVVAWHGLLPG